MATSTDACHSAGCGLKYRATLKTLKKVLLNASNYTDGAFDNYDYLLYVIDGVKECRQKELKAIRESITKIKAGDVDQNERGAQFAILCMRVEREMNRLGI